MTLVVSFATPGTQAQEPAAATSQDITANVGIGGIGRYITNRWGVVRAWITNRRDTASSSLVVVTPAGSGGLQYARQIEIPGKHGIPDKLARTDGQS